MMRLLRRIAVLVACWVVVISVKANVGLIKTLYETTLLVDSLKFTDLRKAEEELQQALDLCKQDQNDSLEAKLSYQMADVLRYRGSLKRGAAICKCCTCILFKTKFS